MSPLLFGVRGVPMPCRRSARRRTAVASCSSPRASNDRSCRASNDRSCEGL
jgi:hypothetical protein